MCLCVAVCVFVLLWMCVLCPCVGICACLFEVIDLCVLCVCVLGVCVYV